MSTTRSQEKLYVLRLRAKQRARIRWGWCPLPYMGQKGKSLQVGVPFHVRVSTTLPWFAGIGTVKFLKFLLVTAPSGLEPQVTTVVSYARQVSDLER